MRFIILLPQIVISPYLCDAVVVVVLLFICFCFSCCRSLICFISFGFVLVLLSSWSLSSLTTLISIWFIHVCTMIFFPFFHFAILLFSNEIGWTYLYFEFILLVQCTRTIVCYSSTYSTLSHKLQISFAARIRCEWMSNWMCLCVGYLYLFRSASFGRWYFRISHKGQRFLVRYVLLASFFVVIAVVVSLSLSLSLCFWWVKDQQQQQQKCKKPTK